MRLTSGPLFQRLAVVGFVVLAAFRPAHADVNNTVFSPDMVTTTTCEAYPQVTCTGENPEVVSEILQMATDTRETLGPLLRLGRTWRYPVHILVVRPDSPLADKVKGEETSVIADGNTLRIEAALPSSDLNPREFIQRQFVTAILWEKYFKPGMKFTSSTRLDMVPIWLVEGLREWLNEDPDHNREETVKRAALAKRAPTLAEVTSWQEISDDRLLGLWQRAFCYYLVDSLLHKDERRVDFQEWIDSITGPNPSSAIRLFPTEMGWQRELLEAPGRSRDIVYTWDESAAELAAAETIVLPKGKEADDARVCTIETVSAFPRTPEVANAIGKKIFDLTALELRAHPSWRPIISLYRLGLTALINDKDPKHAADYFHQANLQRATEMNNHQKLVDYTNWYEVTNSPAESSRFSAYFRTAEELDKAEPDPAHPNPLRARLLKVEAEF
jgi:hypothetical protein